MTDTIRLAILAAGALAALVATVLVTRHVAWGGDATGEGTVAGVRPGADDAGAVTAYHYRLTSRFGFYVKVHVGEGEVSISGARLAPGAYAFFIGGSVLLMLASGVALLAAALWLDWRYLLAAFGLFFGYYLFSMLCAAGLYSLPDSGAMASPGTHDKVTFPVSSVRDVKVGPGWDRQGIGFVIFSFVKGVDSLAGEKTVSFLAPDPTTKSYVTYGMCCYTEQDAADLARMLRGQAEGEGATA
jgi:hypothetical protein